MYTHTHTHTQAVEKVGWTPDGQVLTVATTAGQLFSFLSALPMVFDFYGTKVLGCGHLGMCMTFMYIG